MSNAPDPTPLEQALRRLQLTASARRYPELAAQAVTAGWSHIEYLERLVEAEVQHRQEARIARAARHVNRREKLSHFQA